MTLVSKAFSDIITFSRSSNATRIGPNGLVQYAPHNLILQSQTFDNASWTKNAASLTANTTAAPDGSVTADNYVPDTTTTGHNIYQACSVTSGVIYTLSVYAKAAGYNYLALYAGAFSQGKFFDLANGLVLGDLISSPTSAAIQSVGNGWYRCSITFLATSTTSSAFSFYPSTTGSNYIFAGNGTSGIYIWGAQLAVGPLALDYTPTTTAAVYGPRFDYDGSGVTSVDPIARNLVLYSEQFDNAAWTKDGATANSNVTVAPDGTTTADTIIESAITGDHRVYQTISQPGSAYTLSVFAKSFGRRYIFVRLGSGTGTYGAVFDLQTGAFSSQNLSGSGFSSTSYSISSSGNGWYRCSVTAAGSITNQVIALSNTATASDNISYTGDGTSGAYLWGAQLEVGSTATGYMVSGATNGFRAVPVVSGSATARGLLVEEQRTNLCPYSEQFGSGTWVLGGGAALISNSGASPSGEITADKLYPATTGTLRFVYYDGVGTSWSANTVYTVSCFIKADGKNWGYLRFEDKSNASSYVFFNLSTGVVGSTIGTVSVTGKIENFGNGWYRCSVTGNTGTGAGGLNPVLVGPADADGSTTATASGTSGILVWGFQAEAGAFATSYIPTLASTVTRSADVASVNTLSPWFNATEGTLYAEFDYPPAANLEPVSMSDGTIANTIEIYRNGAQLAGYIVSGSTLQANMSSASISTTNNKAAIVVKANDFAFCLNGGTVITDTSGSVPVGLTTLHIGRYALQSTFLNGSVRRIAFYPRRLTNAELQALTA